MSTQTSTGRGGARPGTYADDAPRLVRLSLTKVDPFSVAKVAFFLSVAFAIMSIVAVAIIWFVLDSMHIFAAIEDLFVSVGSEEFGSLVDYLQFGRVLSVSALIAFANALIVTALCALGALLYNLTAAAVGGLRLTLTDD